MNNNNVMHDVGWSPVYKKMQDYGKEFINNLLAANTVASFGDLHVIVHRSMGNAIPDWIVNSFTIAPEILQVFAIPPGALGMIHKDGINRKATFNIPISGYTKGDMHWFSDNEALSEFKIDCSYTKVRLTNEEINVKGTRLDLEPEVICTVNAPSILNTNVWHRIDNRDNANWRWVLSIRFAGNPEYNTLIEKIA